MLSCSDEQSKETVNKTTAPPAPTEIKKETPKPSVKKTDEYAEEKINLGLSVEDKKQLQFLKAYPIGTPFKKIHDEMNLKNAKQSKGSDEMATQGYTEVDTKVNIMGKSADLQLNFKNDSLYGYSYKITENDFNKGGKIYKGLQQFYAEEFGPCKELTSEEETLTTRSCNWSSKKALGTIIYDVNTGEINWGFQRRE